MRKPLVAPLLAVVVVAFLPSSPDSAQAPASPTPAVKEELLFEKDAGAVPDDEDVVSEDGRHAAWRTGREKKWGVVLDGKRLPGEFEEVDSLTFSPDGKHLAFAARRGKAWMMVLDGKETAQAYEKAVAPRFSGDGTRLAFVGKLQGKMNVVLNGEAVGSPFDMVDLLMFAPGDRLAVVGLRKGKRLVMLDGKEGPPFDVIGGLEFTRDGRRFGYGGAMIKGGLGGDKGLGRVVLDGELGPEYLGEKTSSFLKAMAMGPTSLAPGYLPDLSHWLHGVSSPTFSADGSHVAFVIHRAKDDEVVVVDGQPGPQFPVITTPLVFCPKSQRLAYGVRRGENDETVMLDGQPGPKVATLESVPWFCGEGRHIAYVVSDARGKFLMVDGEKVGPALLPDADFVTRGGFSPDGRHTGFVVARQNMTIVSSNVKRRVYVDGQPGRLYDSRALTGLDFTADSRHVIYSVHHLKDASPKDSFVVIDQAEGKRYDSVWTRTVEDREREITYVAQSGGKFLRVTQALQ
jgi:hypothetical protein